jgi:hypothetical protein
MLTSALVIGAQLPQATITFNGKGSLNINPLAYTQNFSIFGGDVYNQTTLNVFTVTVLSQNAQLTIQSQVINTTQLFSSLQLNLTFTQGTQGKSLLLNGFTNQTYIIILPKGSYQVALNLAYTAQQVVELKTGNWILTFSG